MAQLYFYYSAMNAGKSTVLLQSAYNYQERGMDVLLFTPDIDTRYAKGMIHSRIGLKADAITFDLFFDLYDTTQKALKKNPNIKCILVDEAQFLSKTQVSQLSNIVDQLHLPVLTYGIRSDFRGEPFEGSLYLLTWADNITELKTVCHCGKKATMNARVDENGNIITTGEQIHIGGTDRYISMCRRHFKEAGSM